MPKNVEPLFCIQKAHAYVNTVGLLFTCVRLFFSGWPEVV